jgi:hypothetical protein
MLQPISSRPREQERELDFSLNVLREYGEELLGLEELENSETADVLIKHIESNKYLRKLRKQIEDGDALLEVTGLVLDVFRLRPEVTFLLVLKDDCYAKNLKTNWEAQAKSLDLIELNDESAFYDLIEDMNNPLCAPGLAALINGRERAIKYLKSGRSSMRAK